MFGVDYIPKQIKRGRRVVFPVRRRDLEFGQGGYDGRMLPCPNRLGGALRGEKLRRGVWVELRGREGGRSSLGTVGGGSVCQSVLIREQDATYI
jgi:hypothetical protein